MKIERKIITIAELAAGFVERDDDSVAAYGGKLNVRPPYQREYIYKPKERDAVIRTVQKNFPVNVMYWAKSDDGYDLMDGQQRTIAICSYVAGKFSVDHRAFFNLTEDRRADFLRYELDIYICDGKPSEILDWFKVINIAGLKLSDQEMRNVSYTGSWLADAKKFFSKVQGVAYRLASKYLNGSANRQDYLETALKWIIDRDGLSTIEDYMSAHQHDENAAQLTLYFRRVIEWVQAVFPKYRAVMKGIDWGILYNAHKDDDVDPAKLEREISRLILDDDVKKKSGIYAYVLDGDERHLNLRTFSDAMKLAAYERQGGICAACGKHFELAQMEGDHITPWSKGGKTTADNCQMLCADCNRRKGNR